MTSLFLFLGEVIDTDDVIVLEDVPVITPNGDVVVRSLSFKVGDQTTVNKPKNIHVPYSSWHALCMYVLYPLWLAAPGRLAGECEKVLTRQDTVIAFTYV